MPTIGVAVAVPEPWASELQRYRAGLGDPLAAAIPTHITLVPPTVVDDPELAAVERHLADAAGGVAPYRVRLRGTGTFRPVSAVVFVAVAEGAAECEELADAVRRGPLAVDLEHPYHPHVTIAHHVADDRLDRAARELSGFDCAFEVDGLRLYTHDATQGWTTARRFGLGSGT